MATWKLSTELVPNYDGGLMRAKYLIGGLRTVKTKAQRNAIPYLYRYLSVEESTIVFVEDDKQFYRLINNPSTTTVNGDWSQINIGDTTTLTPIGTWKSDNTTPILSDIDAAGRNGEFYFVTGAPTPQNVTIVGLFEGKTVTVVDGNMIVSVGGYWIVTTNSTAWESISKPQSITDYVNGTVISHTHVSSQISDLGTYLINHLKRSDTADHTISFNLVADTAIPEVEFLKTHYYTKDDINNIFNDGNGINEFIDLIDTPSTYLGAANKFVRVNELETNLEFVTADYWKITGTTTLTGNNIITGGETNKTILFRTSDATTSRSTLSLASTSVLARNNAAGSPNMFYGGDTRIEVRYNKTTSGLKTLIFDDVGMTITDVDNKGLVNASDYSANFTDRSLVDKGYVLGVKTFTGKQTFSHTTTTVGLNVGLFAGDPSSLTNGDVWYNSLTGKFQGRQEGSSVDLANINYIKTDGNSTLLTHSDVLLNNFDVRFLTAANLTSRIFFGETGNTLNIFSLHSKDIKIHSRDDGFESLTFSPLTTDLRVSNGVNNSIISMRTTGISVSGNLTTFPGIQYGGDYSANYTDSSVVDKKYVLGAKIFTGKQDFALPPILPSYTVVGIPPAATYIRGLIYVSDEIGGAVPAFSDGTNWRRVTDRAIIS